MNRRDLTKSMPLVLTILSCFGLSCSGLSDRAGSAHSTSSYGSSDDQQDPGGLEQSISRLRGCLPTAESTSWERISISSIERLPNRTHIKLVVWAGEQSFDLQLPLYHSSRGRWLLGDQDRVYVVDQECRQYGLQDVEFLQPRQSPGLIRIPAHQVITGTLVFPPLSTRARFGALIYGKQSLRILFPDPSSIRP